MRGIYAYNTQNEEKVVKERATKSIFDEDLSKKPLNEAGRSNNDLSWAYNDNNTPSIQNTGFLNQAPDK